MSDRGLDPKGLEAAVHALRSARNEESVVAGLGLSYRETVGVILAAYFDALEPVMWEAEIEGLGWVGYRMKEGAVIHAGHFKATGHIRALYPGPVEELSDER